MIGDNISTETARIRALKTSMVSLLETEREHGIPLRKVEQGTELLIEAYQNLLNQGTKQLVVDEIDRFGATISAIEDAYADWRAVDAAFRQTLALAYNGTISRQNLLLDSIHAHLTRTVGEPVSMLYTRLHAAWDDHLTTHPWDAYMVLDAHHIDTDVLHANLHSLVHGDHLDVEDALEGLTGVLRPVFANYLQERKESVDLLEESLWMRPEIVVANDYWRGVPKIRILDILRRSGYSKVAASFAKVQQFFANGGARGNGQGPERIVEEVRQIRPENREQYLRCLMLHPNQEIRRYATSNVDIEGFWKVITPQAVPCATILTMLEKVAGFNNYDDSFQKVFFNSIHRRLLHLTSRSEVIYARGIVRILSRLPFFMEDEYFEKLMQIVDYISGKEKVFRLGDGILDEYVNELRADKDRIGTLQTQAPNLTTIPPVVLRKLARDGHFWYDLTMHPMFKIARETIPHISTPTRALRTANNHMVNQEVLRGIGKNRSLFNTLPAKMALLGNPRTPPTVSLAYLSDLARTDVEALLRKSTIHPELRLQLRRRLEAAR